MEVPRKVTAVRDGKSGDRADPPASGSPVKLSMLMLLKPWSLASKVTSPRFMSAYAGMTGINVSSNEPKTKYMARIPRALTVNRTGSFIRISFIWSGGSKASCIHGPQGNQAGSLYPRWIAHKQTTCHRGNAADQQL